MNRKHLRLLARIALLGAPAVAGYLATTTLHAQGVTTSGLAGTVLDETGKPVSNASVVVVHVPSGTRVSTTTRANGQFNVSGLRSGGPYTVTSNATAFTSGSVEELYLELGQTADVTIKLASDAVKMEAFKVVADPDTTFGSGKIGTGSSFDNDAIENVSSVRRNVQDVAALDSRMFLGSLDQGGQLSAQGQNFRFNSFVVDGVQASDTFGLNSSGFGSQRSPVPLESLQSLSVQLSPYDVRYAGFTGALINAVTKSGTNKLEGTVYYEFTNENLRAKNPVSGVKEAFDERTYGINITGPIIRNKLFFAFTYDNFERETVAPQANFVPDAAGLASIAQIIARAKALGYDPGSLGSAGSNIAKQETYIGKLDWNINDSHRLSATYRRNYGEDTVFANYTGTTTTSLSNHWYQQPRNTDSYVAQLNSQWTPDFRTEATASYSKYDGSPANMGASFPMVTVQGISGTRLDTGATVPSGAIVFGTENSRQLNRITTKESQMKLNGEYSLGNHTITVGAEDIITKYTNAFVQNTEGVYTFASATTWVAGTPPTALQVQRPYAGFTIDDAVARWQYEAYAGFVQDTWKVNSKLTLMGGLRYDYPYIPEKPPVATGFSSAGFTTEGGKAVTRNDTTNSGNATLAPRIGFTYEFETERKTQLRGGIGLFQGKNPAVWISNAYSNAGAVYNYTAPSSALPTTVFTTDASSISGSTTAGPNINITDPDFKQPSSWKSNIALDHQLPFGGLTFTAEYYYIRAEDAVTSEFLNYRVATSGPTTLPDGRIRYAGTVTPASNSVVPGITSLAAGQAAFGTGNVTAYNATTGVLTFASSNVNGRRRVSTGGPVGTGFADVFYLTNTKKGDAKGLTLSIARPMKNKWAWSASWTRGDANEVSPITSSTASSNYSNRAVFNPNEDVSSTSNTEIKDRVVISLTRQFEFVRKAPTTISLVYMGRTGHNYSWVFAGDANGDGYTFNDLLYVPTGPTDPKVTWGSIAQRDAFFELVESTSLKDYKGRNAPRNSETSPWLNTMDLKITQTLPIFRSVRAEVFANLVNFANLFDKSWGIQEEVPFAYRRAVAGAVYNAAGNGGAGAWTYVYNSSTLNGVPVTVNDTPVSRWQAQLGMRLKF